MSKNLFTKFFVLLLVVGLLFAVAPTGQALAETPSVWDGTYPAAKPADMPAASGGIQEVTTAAQFAWLASQTTMFEAGVTTVKLMVDINLDSKAWTPSNALSGSYVTLDGNGHTITNLKVEIDNSVLDGTYYAAMFTSTSTGWVTIQNLTIDGAVVSQLNSAIRNRVNSAVLVGIDNVSEYGITFNNVTIKNATVNGTKYVAAIEAYGRWANFTGCTVQNVILNVNEQFKSDGVTRDLPHIGSLVGLDNAGQATGNTISNLAINFTPVSGQTVDTAQTGTLIGTAQSDVLVGSNTISGVTLNGASYTKLIGLDDRTYKVVNATQWTGYTTIQDAVTAANAGDVIVVGAGNYSVLNVLINKSMTLVGDPGDETAGPGPNAPVLDGGNVYGDAFRLGKQVSNVVIKGFEIKNYATGTGNSQYDGVGNAISAWDVVTSYITIRDNYFHDLGYNAVLVGNDKNSDPNKWGDHTNWLIEDNIVANAGYIGFELTNTSNSSIKDNVIHLSTPYIGAIFSSARRSESNLTISGNVIDGTPSTLYPVIYIYANDLDMPNPVLNTVSVVNNTINTTGTPFQVYLRNIGTGTVTNVQVEYNTVSTVKNLTSASVDASPNWWGSAAGPTPSQMSGTIAYIPWCADAACTEFAGPVTNVTRGTYFATIQAAIDDAATAAGDVIQVAPGTFTGQININKPVSIIGSGKEGPNATIITSNALGTVLLGATGTVDSPILLKDLQVTGAWGVRTSITPIDYFTMDNVWLNANPVKSGEGFRLVTGHQLSHLTINNSIIEGYIDGVIIEKTPGTGDAGTKLQYVSVTNTIFRNNYRKGLYVETLSDAVFTNVQLINNGYVNPGTNLAEYNSAGFDLNLKDGTYSNLQFINMTATGNGLYAKDGAALMIKARSDGATYGLYPATLTNVTITGGSFTGNERGIRFGEPGKSNAGPTNVVINGATILNNVKTYAGNDGSAYGDLVNLSLAPVNATKNWWGSAAGPVAGQIVGNVAYCAWLDSAPPAGVPVAYPVTNTTTLEGFCTIQAAIDDAETLGGHTITVAAGTYVENVVVDKSVEISGAGQANTFVIPAISNPAGGDGSLYPGASNVFLVQASDVKIHDLTVDGDNPALTSTYNVGGANLDARNGIITDHTLGLTFSNLQVYNTTVKNIYLRGIYASTTGGTFNFHHNTVTNVQAEYASIAIFAYYGPGVISNNTVSYANDAISANHSRGIQFLNNTVTHSGSGIHTDNSNSSGGVADLIQGNSVDCTDSPNAYGIWTFVPYVAPTVNNNTVTNCAIGLSAWGQGAAVTTQFTNNTVTGDLSAGSVGVYVTTDLISWGYTDVSVNFTGNTITGHETAMAFVAGEQAAWNPGPFVPKTINAVFHQNKIFGNTYEVSKDEGGLAYNADVTLNWWGSACGPTSIPAGIPYSPWYTNDAFTSTATGTTGSYTFPTGSTAASINSVIACAAPDSTLTFDGLYPGGIIVPADRTDLTFKLSNDTVITGTTAAGYCFNVFGDHIRIETENFEYGLPKCVPAGDSSGIYVNWNPVTFGMPTDNAVLDLIIDGFDIDGTDKTQSGITLSNDITDVQILNNYIHNCSVAIRAEDDIQGRFDIQGNMFKENTSNIVDSVAQGIDASYNSWGVWDDPTATVVGDAAYTPWTHMELFIEQTTSDSTENTPWVAQLVSDGTMDITYAIKADMSEITGAEFLLKIPAGLTVKSVTVADVFDTQSAWAVTGGVQYYGAQFDTTVAGSEPVTGQAITLFTVTLTASAPGTYDLTIDETTDAFSMLPPMEPAPSTWVYLDEAHKATLKAIELPTMTTTLTDNYEIGVAQEFTVTITNPSTGGLFTDPVLVFAGLPAGTSLEYESAPGVWATFVGDEIPGLIIDGVPVVLNFRVTFTAPAGAYPITITLNDSLTTPDEFLAQTSGTATVTLLSTPVVGTLSMQGRAYRGDIPMTLTPTTLTGFTACTEESINHISNNITFVGCLVGDTYVITTNQARYLDVTVYLNKTINLLTPDYFITALELKAGDADDSNKIDVSDAGIVGGAYGTGSDVRGDVNFDGKFNIQDLALVGGNYGYDTSVTGTDLTNPYLTWVP